MHICAYSELALIPVSHDKHDVYLDLVELNRMEQRVLS
jgi:hypothetical protein